MNDVQENRIEDVKNEETNTPDAVVKKHDFKRIVIVLVAFFFIIGMALYILISAHVICLEHG